MPLAYNPALEGNSCFENKTTNQSDTVNEIHKDDSTLNDIKFVEICKMTFVKSYWHVSILTFENMILNPNWVYKQELGPVEWHTTTTTFKASEAVILVVESAELFHQLITIQSLWSQDATYVIFVLQCTTDVKKEMANLWQFKYIYKYVLICGVKDYVLYIFKPFYSLNRSNIGEISDLFDIRFNILHGTDNLHKAKMRVVFFPRVPTAMRKNGTYIGGADYLSLVTLRERMNFTTVMARPSDRMTFTQAGENVTGSARDIVIGNADIAFNGHFVQDYKIPGMRLTRYVYMDKICFIVGMPTLKSHFTVISL